uniref:MaoC domain protein dehydratase n=1 Tax=Caulobacter sp. (strain K31) TaxID=366602 RepID=B0T6G7_CAUSK
MNASPVQGPPSGPGDVAPDLVFGPVTRTTLALYAGASGDHNPIHIDSDYARAAGLPDVLAHGMLSFGVLARAVSQWAGAGQLRAFGVRFLSITQVHDTITCTAVVSEAFVEDGEPRLRLRVSARAQDGRETLAGEAVIARP